MQNLLSRVGNPALRQGIIFGVILGIVLIALNFFIGGIILIAGLTLVAGLLAGMRASRETGRTVTGALGGLWTGLFGLIIFVVIYFIFILITIDAQVKSGQQYANSQHLNITYTPSLIITSALLSSGILIVLGVLLGLAGGVIGGMMGRSRAQLPPPREYEEAMFEPPQPKTPAE